MPTPVSSNRTSTRLRGAGAARQAQRAAVRHRLTGVDRQIQKRLPQHRGIAIDRRDTSGANPPRRGRCSSAPPARSAAESRRRRLHAHGLQAQILGPRELQEALHHLVEPPDLALDHFDVLQRIRLACALRRARFGEAKAAGADRLRLAAWRCGESSSAAARGESSSR